VAALWNSGGGSDQGSKSGYGLFASTPVDTNHSDRAIHFESCVLTCPPANPRYTEARKVRRSREPVDTNIVWGVALAFAVLGTLGVWFHRCGRADRARRMRPFAMRTLRFAGLGFVLGVALLTADLGSAPAEWRMTVLALVVCCFLLIYSAGSAAIASNDQSLVVVNLTGRGLLLSDTDLAPFYTLPAQQEEPAIALPPARPRTYYVVSTELGRLAADAGRSDVFTVEATTSPDFGEHGPLQVRRLLRAVPDAARSERA
jgi:hypothetical protein